MWHYARGVALASQGKVADASAEADAIQAIARSADFSLLKASGIPADEVLATSVILGRVAQAHGKFDDAVLESFQHGAGMILPVGLPRITD